MGENSRSVAGGETRMGVVAGSGRDLEVEISMMVVAYYKHEVYWK